MTSVREGGGGWPSDKCQGRWHRKMGKESGSETERQEKEILKDGQRESGKTEIPRRTGRN